MKNLKPTILVAGIYILSQISYAGNCDAPAAPGVDWSNCNKVNLNLSGVDLSQANLNGANLRDTNLSQAKLNGANLRDTNLSQAKLNGASFIKATIIGLNIDGASLDGTLWLSGEKCAAGSIGRCYDGGEKRFTLASANNCMIDNFRGTMWPRSGTTFVKISAQGDNLSATLKEINRQQYCGYSDWQLPKLYELSGLYQGSASYVSEPGSWLEERQFTNMHNTFWGDKSTGYCPADGQDFVNFYQGNSGCITRSSADQYYLFPVRKSN